MNTLTRTNAKSVAAKNAERNRQINGGLSFDDLDDKNLSRAVAQAVASSSTPLIGTTPTPMGVINRTPKSRAKKERPLMTSTSLKYLEQSLRKECEPYHPNFERVLKPKTRQQLDHIKSVVAAALKSHPDNVKLAAATAGAALAKNTAAYVTYWKNILSNAAFMAHMELLQFERTIDADVVLEGMGGMFDDEDRTTFNTRDCVFDQSLANRAAEREEYAGSDRPAPLASSAEDAHAAIIGLQAWVSLAFGGFKAEQAEFWGVDGLTPFGQRKDYIHEAGEAKYTPIRDFDDYREYQNAQWDEKKRVAPGAHDAIAAMMAA
jgi:hypothetical protein